MYGISMHVAKLFDAFLRSPNIEVVKIAFATPESHDYAAPGSRRAFRR
jgi:hypothetical protein